MHVYIVEQNNLVKKTLEDFLKQLKHEISSFDSIDSLLYKNNENHEKPDLILVNLDLPQKEAVFHVRKIHTKYPDANITIMSSVLPAQEALSQGVFSYLHRPIRLDELELILARISESREKK